jgi:uncharacterized protein YbaP (TraB family)
MILRKNLAAFGIILTLLFSCPASADFFYIDKYLNGLLWRVQKEGVPDSYIFGTIHIIDQGVYQLLPKVEQTLDNGGIDTLCTEVPLDSSNLQLAWGSALMQNKSLNTLTGDPLYAATASLLERKSISRDISIRLKPWTAMVLLMFMNGNRYPIDVLIHQAATQRKIKTCALETMPELIGQLDSMPVQSQIVMLQDTVDNYQSVAGALDRMISSYLAADLMRLTDAVNDGVAVSQNGRDLNKQFMYQVLIGRNRLLVDRMQAQLSKGKVFIAMSALHLGGNEGVLNLLEQRGYQITRLY